MPNQATPVLNVKDLEVSFRTRAGLIKAVRCANLTINPGEAVGLVGESGSGKSTVARSIPGLLPRKIGRITGGRIDILGRTVSDLPESELTKLRGNPVAMIFQDPLTYLNPVHTIGKQIGESIVLNDPAARIGSRTSELLELVRLPASVAAKYPHQLSGGMRQRALIAIALAAKPAILIADEPTTALDVTTQAEIITLIGSLRKELGMALLLISHDIGVISEACDRVVVMYAGATIETGPTLEVLTNPSHHYTSGLLLASLVSRDINGRFAFIPGELPTTSSDIDGCAFRNRCVFSIDSCVEEQPSRPVGNDHFTRCCRPELTPKLQVVS